MNAEPFETSSPAPDTMTLAELDRLHGLSVRAFNVCGNNELKTLGDIRRYKRVHDELLHLFGCGKKTAIELEDLLEKVGSEAPEPAARTEDGRPPPDAAAIDESALLTQIETQYCMLSARARNVIAEYLGDDSPKAILGGVVRSDFAFRNLKNVGLQTIRELELFRSTVCGIWPIRQANPLAGNGSNEPPLLGLHPPAEFAQTELDVPAAIAAIIGQWARLTVRAQNVLEHFAGSAEPQDLLRALVANEFAMPKLRNSGIKTQSELEQFALVVNQCAIASRGTRSNASRAIAHLGNALRAHFTPAEVQYINPAEFVNAHDEVNVLALLHRVADLHSANPALTWRIFQAFASQPGYKGTSADLAIRMEVSRERVRQIELQLNRLLQRNFGFLKKLELPLVLRSMIEQGKPAVIIPPEQVDQVNSLGSTQWTAWFIAQLTDLMGRGKLKHIGWKQMGLNSLQARDLDHRAPLLVTPHLIEDLTRASRTLLAHLERPRIKDEAVLINELVRDARKELLPEMEAALRVIIPFLSPNIALEPGMCILPVNRKRRMEDLLEEVLVEFNQPTHVDALVERLRNNDPNHEWSVEGVRSVVVRFKDRFISFSRTSTYGLRKWEQQKENIKGGTIRDIAFEVLQAEAMQIHVDALTTRIQRYRPTTNKASVRLNLQLDQEGRFILYPNGFIGLSSKVYERIPEPMKRVPSTFFRVSVLRRFVGSTVSDVVEFLEKRSEVESSLIRALLAKKVLDGTIVLGEGDRITAITQVKPGVASDLRGTGAVGELPFDWGDE